MHCPACNKDFSPVHSRCPDCNGWLRTAKSGANGASSRPSGSVAAPNGLASPVASSELPTQKIGTSNAGVTLPSRPSARPAAAAAAPAPAPPLGTPTLGGPPAVAPRVAAAPDDSAFGGRGGLGSGWESSGSFAAPTPAPPPAGSQWGGDGMATGRLQPPAAPSGGWGNGVSQPPAGGLGGAPAASGWGAPAAPNGLGGAPTLGAGGGWGATAAPAPGLGGGGLGGGPSLGGPGPSGPPASASSWGAAAAPSNTATSPGGGGGWLGDGGAAAPSPGPSMYAPPPARSSESWLGGGDAPAAPSSLGPPPASEMKLELPDHTVAVDLGTPWEDDELAGGASSNKMIYIILGCLVLSLTVFSAYLYYQNSKLHQKTPPVAAANTETSAKLGENYWKKAQASFAARRYEEAQQSAELARDLLVTLKGYPKAKQVAAFYAKVTNRYALSLFEQAKRANAAEETNQAIALCNQAAQMYSRVKGTSKQQAAAYAYEARIYEGLGDSAAAESSYRKAHSLNSGGGYDRLASAARRSGAPAPPPPPPGPAEPPPEVEQPSIGGDGGLYPTGHGGGGYHAPAPAPAPAAVPSGPAPRPRPASTYVPPKKVSAPRKSDQLPTYNH